MESKQRKGAIGCLIVLCIIAFSAFLAGCFCTGCKDDEPTGHPRSEAVTSPPYGETTAGDEKALLPLPRYYVNDSAHLLTPGQFAQLEAMLEDYVDSTSSQIYVVTVPDFQGWDANSFATRLGNQWRAGRKGVDNGVILLLRPGSMPPWLPADSLKEIPDGIEAALETTLGAGAESQFAGYTLLLSLLGEFSGVMLAKENLARRPAGDYGEGYIAVGYGMEEKITDAEAARIAREIMGPLAVAGRYDVALQAGVSAVMAQAAGKFQWRSDGAPRQPGDDGDDELPSWGRIIFLYLLAPYTLGFIVYYFLQRNRPTGEQNFVRYFRSNYVRILFKILIFILMAVGRGGGGSGGRSSSGRSNSGGGGSFGGGGGGARF